MINLKEIKKSIYFKNLTDLDFNALLRCIYARAREYNENDIIVSPTDSTKDIYLIISGIAREKANTSDGELIIGQDFKKNQIFGLEYTALKDKQYRSSLIALTNCIVLICDRYRFMNPCENACPRHLELNKNTMLELSRIIVSSKSRVIISTKKKTREKVLAFLNNLAKENKTKEFYISYSREELAIFLGVERTALSAELSAMKKEGIIYFNKNYFKILN